MIGVRDETAGGGPASECVEHVGRVFAAGGWLQRELGLEHRPQQEAMALAVAEAMLGDESLLFEAGTGVGKSLAYLIPGIIRAQESERPCVVSTHTISLQEQIQTQDLSRCRHLFETVRELHPFAGFKSAVLVGKANYLCRQRLSHALQNRTDLLGGPEQDELLRIAAWAEKTEFGLGHELQPPPHPEVWEWVNADSSSCGRRKCSPENCPYQAARARIRCAQVVIVNHSLLFALINAGGLHPGARGVLLPDDFLILDEAHTMADVATEHFGLHVSSYSVDRLLKTLFNPRRRTGLLKKFGEDRDRQRVLDAAEASLEFFDFVRERLVAHQPITRVREPGFCEPTILQPLRLVVDSLDRIGGRLEDGWTKDDLADHKSRVASCHDRIRAFLDLADEAQVHWVERGGRKGQIVMLRTAPVNVAPQLREAVFSRGTSVVLTSATLAVAGRIEPFQHRTGSEDVAARIVASPFDFDENMRVFVAADMPHPSRENARLALEELVDWIRFCALRVKGGSLVLFTSHGDLRWVADELESDFQRAQRPLFVQGREFSRSELTARFCAAGNGVLIGTDSFWTGVDIPGPALSQVIITRLPFDVPTHPIAEARAEWVREHGGNPFVELNLPEALVKFRQGMGRLIRRHDDCGAVTVLDSRILHKSYGREFLACLPTARFKRLTLGNREAQFQPFV